MAGRWELIETEVKEYTADVLAIMLNDDRGTDYATLAAGLLSLGAAAVATSIFSRYVVEVKSDIADALTAIGFTITLAGVAAMLEENSDKESLEGPLNMAAANNGTVTITTKSYQWVTGSGNSYTWKTETSYKYNKY